MCKTFSKVNRDFLILNLTLIKLGSRRPYLHFQQNLRKSHTIGSTCEKLCNRDEGMYQYLENILGILGIIENL
jgi:hypothetical protein